MAELNVLDSSALIAYFAAEPNADLFGNVLEEQSNVIVPIITILEVYRRLAADDPRGADEVKENLFNYRVIPIDREVVEHTCRLKTSRHIAFADSIIYATAQMHRAVLWTQDRHFAGLPGVRYLPKSPPNP
jgi:predicted nucleic acid-binding protein